MNHILQSPLLPRRRHSLSLAPMGCTLVPLPMGDTAPSAAAPPSAAAAATHGP